MTVNTCIKAAKSQKKKLLSALKKASQGKKIPEDYEFVCLLDLGQLIKYYSLVEKKKFALARREQNEMDTDPRDRIVQDVYDFIHEMWEDE